MAGGVSASAQLLADVAGVQAQSRVDGVEQGGLTCTGVSAEGAGLVLEHLHDRLDTLMLQRPRFIHGKACFAVNIGKFLRVGKVALGDDDDRLDLLIFCNGNQFIQNKGVRSRVSDGNHQHQLVQICQRRAHQAVAARLELYDIACSLLGQFHRCPIAHTGFDVLLTKGSPRSAFDDRTAGLRCHIVKSTQRFDDPAHYLLLYQDIVFPPF